MTRTAIKLVVVPSEGVHVNDLRQKLEVLLQAINDSDVENLGTWFLMNSRKTTIPFGDGDRLALQLTAEMPFKGFSF
ncbi:MAG: hypothetical protein AAF664_20515 [Planctomycetota bacterium]